MLTSISLRNFQNHKEVEVPLDRITTLVGPTAAGKTAVLRALRLTCLNQPLKAKPLVRKGQTELVVVLEVDGKKITRKVGRHNLYLLGDKEFRAFGQGKVPDEIAALLNLGPTNFQRQLDLPFWFTETPGQVSRNLNEIVNLSVIDSTLANIAAEVRSSREEHRVTASRYQEAKKKVTDLKWVKEFVRDSDELSAKSKRAKRLAIKSSTLSGILSPVKSLVSTTSNLSQAILDAENLLSAGRRLAKITSQTENLKKLTVSLTKAKKLVERNLPDLAGLNIVRKDADEVAERRRNLEMLVEDLKNQESVLCEVEKELQEAERLLRKQKICPACGQPVRKSSPSSSATYTSAKKHQCRVPKRTTGSTQLPGI